MARLARREILTRRAARLMLAALLLASGAVALADNVEQWGVFEITLDGPTDGNPFVEVRFGASFTDGRETKDVAGFYDGGGVYRVRFMPERTGEWRYETHSNRWPLTGRTGHFTVRAAGGRNHGPVRVAHVFHFAYADGTPFRELGTTCYTWTHRPAEIEEQTLHTLAAAPFNKLRMCVLPQEHGTKFMPPTRFAFAGAPPRAWDFTRFDPGFFQHLEKRIGELRDLGIECDLILFHPYGKAWGFDAMDAASDERYLRYAIARLAAFRNIWWSLANEFDFLRTKTDADWDRFFQLVQREDPYDHLRSIHNGNRLYDYNRPWVTHVSLQDGPATEDAGRVEIYRRVYRKPVVFDEARYEGDHVFRWGNSSGRDMVRRFWVATIAGAYAGHGEYFREPHDVVWLGQGGVLKGESPPRLAFLRQVLADSPPAGIDPIDRWATASTGGRPGEYYRLDLGRAAPARWRFALPGIGIVDGMEFQVDAIDTWAMTITPVPGRFVAKLLDRYTAGDLDGREIDLPAGAPIVLRVRRVGGPAPDVGALPPEP